MGDTSKIDSLLKDVDELESLIKTVAESADEVLHIRAEAKNLSEKIDRANEEFKKNNLRLEEIKKIMTNPGLHLQYDSEDKLDADLNRLYQEKESLEKGNHILQVRLKSMIYIRSRTLTEKGKEASNKFENRKSDLAEALEQRALNSKTVQDAFKTLAEVRSMWLSTWGSAHFDDEFWFVGLLKYVPNVAENESEYKKIMRADVVVW